MTNDQSEPKHILCQPSERIWHWGFGFPSAVGSRHLEFVCYSQSLLTRLMSLSRSSNTGTARSTPAISSNRYFCSNSRLFASCHDSFVSAHWRDNPFVAITRIFPLALMLIGSPQFPHLPPPRRRQLPSSLLV